MNAAIAPIRMLPKMNKPMRMNTLGANPLLPAAASLADFLNPAYRYVGYSKVRWINHALATAPIA